MDQSELDQPSSNVQEDKSAEAPLTETNQSNTESASSFPESSSLGADGERRKKNRRRGGRRHRKKNSSTPESQPEGKLDSEAENEEEPVNNPSLLSDPQAVLVGQQAKSANVGFQSCTYGRAVSHSRCSEQPQSIEGEEEDNDVVEEKQDVPQDEGEAFHTLPTVQKEEKPAEIPEKEKASGAAGVDLFFHPDSERVWLDKRRYDAAESCFYAHIASIAVEVERAQTPEVAPDASMAPLNNAATSADSLAQHKIRFETDHSEEADRGLSEPTDDPTPPAQVQAQAPVQSHNILLDISQALVNIQKSLTRRSSAAADLEELYSRTRKLELDNKSLKKTVGEMKVEYAKLNCWCGTLERTMEYFRSGYDDMEDLIDYS